MSPSAPLPYVPEGAACHPQSFCLITDIDNTLVGDPETTRIARQTLLAERARLNRRGAHLYWVVATGRPRQSAIDVLAEHELSPADFDALVTSVGAELYYPGDDKPSAAHQAYLGQQGFDRHAVLSTMDRWFDNPELQPAFEQFPHKVSYRLPSDGATRQRVARALSELPFPVLSVYAHDDYLDVAPACGAKGGAVDFLVAAWGVDRARVVAAGDSSNDLDLLQRAYQGIVVGNGHHALDELRGTASVFFARSPYAAGILEGLYTLGFLARGDTPRPPS